MKTQSTARVLIVDGNILFSRTYSQVLHIDQNLIINSVSNEKEMFSFLEMNSPDIIIYDLFFASDRVETTLNKIQTHSPKSKIVFLSFETGNSLVDQCVKSGVLGFFDKTVADVNLLTGAIGRILEGETVVLTPCAA